MTAHDLLRELIALADAAGTMPGGNRLDDIMPTAEHARRMRVLIDRARRMVRES